MPMKFETKLKSLIFCAACIILPFASIGCVQSSQSTDISHIPPQTAEIIGQTLENMGGHSEVSSDDTYIITDLCGESISLKYDENMNGIMDKTGALSRFYVYEDQGYYIPSDGRVSYKTMLPAEEYKGNDELDRALDRSDFQRIKKGEELRGLTLESAKGVLEVDENGKTHLTRQWLDFSGSITLNGFVYIFAVDEDGGYLGHGDIVFLVDEGEWAGLPFNERYMSLTQWGTDSSFFWAATAPVINLGNLSDYDISSISDNQGKISEVTVTIGNLSLRNDLNDVGYSHNWSVSVGVIEDIEFK